MKKIFLFIVLFVLISLSIFIVRVYKKDSVVLAPSPTPAFSTTPTSRPVAVSDPLALSTMKKKSYPGSDILIEKQLTTTKSSTSYLTSYTSEGLKQYALMTVPVGKKPQGGWPVILFNHGYIPPAQYTTATSYASMVSPLSQAGYIVFKPDYRGNGNSDGTPKQIYISPDYLTDSMNALASIKKYKDANPQKIGVIGHSMGGNITLHELVMTRDFKAAVILAGVVGDETNILDWWDKRIAQKSIVGNDLDTSYVVKEMIASHGRPQTNPDYWNAIDPTYYLSDISTPVQIQVGSEDEAVPVSFSSQLRDQLVQKKKTVDYHIYEEADHNLAPNTATSMEKAKEFFDTYLQ